MMTLRIYLRMKFHTDSTPFFANKIALWATVDLILSNDAKFNLLVITL